MSSTYQTFDAGNGVTIESNTLSTEQMSEAFNAPAKDGGEKPVEAPEDGAGEPAKVETAPEPQKNGKTPPGTIPNPPGTKHNTGKATSPAQIRVEQALAERTAERRRADAAEARAASIEAELERLRKGGEPAKPAAETLKPKRDGKPLLDDFESHDEWVEAVTEWKYAEMDKAKEAKVARETHLRTETDSFRTFKAQIDDAIKADPTIVDRISADVVNLLPEGPIDPRQPLTSLGHLGQFLKKNGIPAMEYFSANPTEIQRLAVLHPDDFWMELGAIRKGLGAAPTASVPEPKVSKAHAPVRPVTGSATTGSGSAASVEDSDDDYLTKRRAEERRKRGR